MSCVKRESNISNYLEYYSLHIKPAINRLDIAIKCNSRLKNSDISDILGIPLEDVLRIRKEQGIKSINRSAVIKFLENGKSELCLLFQREIMVGSPFIYTIEEIAFIYDFDIDIIREICDSMNFSLITWQNLPYVFAKIPYIF